MHPGHHTLNISIAHHFFRPSKQIRFMIQEPIPNKAPGAPGGQRYAQADPGGNGEITGSQIVVE